jgi:hypothetical protein
MDIDIIKSVLEGQAGLDECKEAMSAALRGVMIKALMDQMQAEGAMLCGPYYRPAPGVAHRRAGSALGQYWLNGAEERFARPRVRQKRGQEVKLKSYAAARKADAVHADILRGVASGVSSRALLERPDRRGVRFGGRPLCLLDGSAALKRAVKGRYPGAVIQRCLVHKERNLRGCLSRKDYPELNRLMNRLRRAQGAQAAREALGDLKRFVAGKNRKALESVEEAGEELIALHLLEAPSTLQVSLLSTNAVENPIRNFRAKTRRVTRWRPQSDMTERWTAYAMLTVEQGFQRISGHRDLPILLRALGWTEENIIRASVPAIQIGIDPKIQPNMSVI